MHSYLLPLLRVVNTVSGRVEVAVGGCLLIGSVCVVMHGGGAFKVLTAGLLRVELAPEEYQLYSEGCGWEEGDN